MIVSTSQRATRHLAAAHVLAHSTKELCRHLRLSTSSSDHFKAQDYDTEWTPARTQHSSNKQQSNTTVSSFTFLFDDTSSGGHVRQPIRGQRLQRLLRGHRVATGKPPLDTSITCRRLTQLLANLSTNINHLRVLIINLALTSKFILFEKGEGLTTTHQEACQGAIRALSSQYSLTVLGLSTTHTVLKFSTLCSNSVYCTH